MSSPVNVREEIELLAQERVLILDGAMGALIQAYRNSSGKPLTEEDFRGIRFKNHAQPLKGCNDLLCLTMPDIISGIHEAYLKAGADIIETNSFNANAISLADYGLEDLAYEISAASARLARKAADSFTTAEKPRFVAGSIGPTSKSASISPDINDPGKTTISWDDLEAAYYDNARGLVDGGADIIIIETIFDSLNAKAAIFAVKRLADERGIDIPLIISATVLSSGGRLLTGQTVEAFCVSVLHASPLALGLNCSFGTEKLKPYITALSAVSPCLVSAHPNAGLPNSMGVYDEDPEGMALHIEEYLREKLVNIVGGCCGSTPAHIAVIAARAENYNPRPVPEPHQKTMLAGLEVLEVNRNHGLTCIGENTNVAGSRKFLSMISDENYENAAEIAHNMIEAGAAIIDVCMDDALLDAKTAMKKFLSIALQNPYIARLPVMIDSSRWEVIEAGLKCLPGKGLINSISLKEGEAEFLCRAKAARSYGAAVVVMLFDEEGQAVSYERRIAVAERSWKLLCGAQFPPEDIVFDPNILAIGTGIAEHELYAMDFLRACTWIRDNCPGAQISGGISNLSFSFRGNKAIRKALHAVFIKHAAEQGLSMAILNPAAMVPYDRIDEDLRDAAEDLILRQKPDSLLALAETMIASDSGSSDDSGGPERDLAWRDIQADERISYAMIHGIEDYIEEDINELKGQFHRSLEIVEGPLMKGMKMVGNYFETGRMFLPQVIRAARVMKKAVAILEPDMEKEKSKTDKDRASAKILVATVKGDVHDIGKNIAALVLGCNGHKIIDLGVMVPAEKILETAISEKVDIIGLSGLIAPSLDEMIHIASEMEKQGFTIPLIIGGAAANLVHTALRIASEYSGPVVYIPDASQAPAAVRSLISETERPVYLEKLKTTYALARSRHESHRKNRDILSLEEARKNKVSLLWPAPIGKHTSGSSKKELPALREIFELPPDPIDDAHIITLNNYPLERVIPHVDWTSFVKTWDLAVNTYPSAYESINMDKKKEVLEKLLEDAKALLSKVTEESILSLRGVVGFFPACSEGDDIVLLNENARFSFLRNQEHKPNGMLNPCLADFVLPRELYTAEHNAEEKIGLFALGAGFGLHKAQEKYHSQNDDYGALLLACLANSLAEAFSEEVHSRLSATWGDTKIARKNKLYGTRPAFGYPACPDHSDKEIAFDLLDAKKRCGFDLTETAMIIPAASVCGMYITHPDSYYFGVGRIEDDQLNDWAQRKGISAEEAGKRLGRL